MWLSLKWDVTKSFLAVILLTLFVAYAAEKATKQQLKYYSWTPKGRGRLNEKRIVKTEDTYFIVHGWKQSSASPVYEALARNYFVMNSDANIILVDYKAIAKGKPKHADKMVNEAGKAFGQKLYSLIKEKKLKPHRIQIFGFSLGAHISGIAARYITKKTEKKIARISAADPMGPLFAKPDAHKNLTKLLQPDDAIMVDITHTSYNPKKMKRYGRVDFYVELENSHQPACVGWLDLGKTDAQIATCDHGMAPKYFAESILSCGIMAHKKKEDKTIIYGQHLAHKVKGIYVVKVNGKTPYAIEPNNYPKCKTSL